MKKKMVNDLLFRLYKVLGAIPLPAGKGMTQSASVTGHVSYAKDMAEVQPYIQRIIDHIRFEEYDDARENLDAVEKWISVRTEQEWQNVFPLPSVYQFYLNEK